MSSTDVASPRSSSFTNRLPLELVPGAGPSALAACYDVGRAINRNSVEGQIEGGAAMGVGYALLEEDQVAAGITLSPNLMTYLIPTALDVPDVTPIVLESGEGMGPWGARGGRRSRSTTAPPRARS